MTTRINRRDRILAEMTTRLRRGTDRLFLVLLVGQWIFTIVLALILAPYEYTDTGREVNGNVVLAIVFGAAVTMPAAVLALLRPGWWATRHTVAVVQMLLGAIMIAVTEGRAETHFHVFASLGALALYRDWKLLPTATAVVVFTHAIGGVFWPAAVYGLDRPAWWTFLEHAAWVLAMNAVLVVTILRSTTEMRRAAAREARLERINASIEAKIEQRTIELKESSERYRDLVENTEAIALEYDATAGAIIYVAPQAARLFESTLGDLSTPGFVESRIYPDDRSMLMKELGARRKGKTAWTVPLDCRVLTVHQRVVYLRLFFTLAAGSTLVRAIALDITHQRQLEQDLQQAQKLESVGRLAAGVAHEINTPIQFVGDSVSFMASAITDVVGVLAKQAEVVEAVLASSPADPRACAAREAAEAADLDYLVTETPKAAERALDGVERVSTIVRSMKVFAHPDSATMTPVDLNHAINTTLTIARNEYRYVADLHTNLADLPLVTCFVGEVNQAVLNIIINSAHAISDVHTATGTRGEIHVSTRLDGDVVEVEIRDSGGGIPDHVRDRIFDPFFTTKDVGKGSGQGLSIARSVVVDRHAGSLRFDTTPGVGTTFFLRLPVHGSARVQMREAA